MSIAQFLGTIAVLTPTISAGQTINASIVANIPSLTAAPVNAAHGSAKFSSIYTQTNTPFTDPTFFVIKSNSFAALTPGFQATVNFNRITPSISMGLISPNFVTNGLLTNSVYGLQTIVQGPPDGIQVPLSILGLSTVIPASSTTTSPVISSFYFPHIICGVTSTQAGALNIQRYIDNAGLVANGAAITASLTGNTATVSDTVSALGFGSFTIQITNTGTLPATISGLVLLLLAR